MQNGEEKYSTTTIRFNEDVNKTYPPYLKNDTDDLWPVKLLAVTPPH